VDICSSIYLKSSVSLSTFCSITFKRLFWAMEFVDYQLRTSSAWLRGLYDPSGRISVDWTNGLEEIPFSGSLFLSRVGKSTSLNIKQGITGTVSASLNLFEQFFGGGQVIRFGSAGGGRYPSFLRTLSPSL